MYSPNEDEFSLNCEFYTDSWEARTAIGSLLKDLAYNPHYIAKGKRKILLRSSLVKRQSDQETLYATVISLQLADAFIDDEYRAFNHNRLIKTQQRLRMLADWSIRYNNGAGESQEHLFLASPDSQVDIQSVKGIVHKLTFYHS